MIAVLLLLNCQKPGRSSAMVELLQLQCRTVTVILYLILHIFQKSTPDLVRFTARHELYFIHRKMRQQSERFDLKSFCDTSHLQIEQLCPLKHLVHRINSFVFRTLVRLGPYKSKCICDTHSMNENVLRNICHPFKDTQPWREHYNFSTLLYYVSLISHPTKVGLERTDSS